MMKVEVEQEEGSLLVFLFVLVPDTPFNSDPKVYRTLCIIEVGCLTGYVGIRHDIRCGFVPRDRDSRCQTVTRNMARFLPKVVKDAITEALTRKQLLQNHIPSW